MGVECLGIDHIYITVSDMTRSEAYYDAVMGLLSFRKGSSIIADDRHCHYYNRHFGFSLRPAREHRDHDPYTPGLHHFCFRVENNAAVERFAQEMEQLGLAVSEPDYHPEYAPDYYAVFFSDPDGVRLEVTNFREERMQRMLNWESL